MNKKEFKFKFRVKDKRTQKTITYFKISDTDKYEFEIYTGLKDNKGQELYTGDRIKFHWGDEAESMVRYISSKMNDIDFKVRNDNESEMLIHIKNIIKKEL